MFKTTTGKSLKYLLQFEAACPATGSRIPGDTSSHPVLCLRADARYKGASYGGGFQHGFNLEDLSFAILVSACPH